MVLSAEEAAAVLGCRPGATAREVRAAFRATVKAGRPDTGLQDGVWLGRVQAARDLLLPVAAPDRRRRDRDRRAPSDYLPLRRSTWEPDAAPAPAIDLRL